MLKLNRNIRVQVGSKSQRRVSVIDNGSDRVFTFDENGLHHLGEQYQLPPTQLNVRREVAARRVNLPTGNDTDYISLGAVGYSYWLSPIANKTGDYFDFARLEKGNVLTIYRRNGDNKVTELTTADLMGGVHPFIHPNAFDDRLYGNAQLFKISNSQYYLSGAQHLDIGETIPQTGTVALPGSTNDPSNLLRGPIAVYDLLNVNNGVSSATKLTQSGTFTLVDTTNNATTAASVVCPTAITYLGNIQGFDVMLQSNATNPVGDVDNVGPVIALVEINTLGQFGGVRFVSYGQSYRIVRLQGNTIREVAFARNDNRSGKPFPNQIGSNLPASTTGRADSQIYFDPNLIGNVAPVQPATGVGVSGFPSIAGLDAFAVTRIGDRYVLNKTTFPSQSNPSTLAVINAPTTSPIAELPTNTFDAFYCNTMLYNAAGKGIDCHLYVTEGGSRQETRIQTQSPVSGGGGEIVTRPSSDSLTGYLRGIRVNEITLPMSFIADDVIYDIDSIDDVNNQTVKIEFSERKL